MKGAALITSVLVLSSMPGAGWAAVIGPGDERFAGSAPAFAASGQNGQLRHLRRTLRVSFPLRGSLTVTATPICSRDIVLTVAHVIRAHGDATADPRGLKISVPDLVRPGEFSEVVAVRNFALAGGRRSLHLEADLAVADDFLLLRLVNDLPTNIEPLQLPSSVAVEPAADADASGSASGHPDVAVPTCDRATMNAAYHDDLGFRDGRVAGAPVLTGPVRLRNSGLVPLLTTADGIQAATEDPARFGDWYGGRFVAFTRHDTATSASGSAIVCPADEASRATDRLQGIVVGQAMMRPTAGAASDQTSSADMRNIVNVNLDGIRTALAALQGVAPERLAETCIERR